MKKHIKPLLIFLGIIIVVVSGWLIYQYFSQPVSNVVGSYDKEIKILNESYPSDIMVYGEDVGFDERLIYRTIDTLTEENLKSESKYKYSFLVINDRSGNLKITDEEFELCKMMCDEFDMNFYYIGEQYLTNLKNFGFCRGLYRDDLRGLAYVIIPNTKEHADVQGFWTTAEEDIITKNPGLLGTALTYSFVDNVIRSIP